MSIWIYKNSILLHGNSLSYNEIYREYNIVHKTIKKYQDNKIYKIFYFSTRKLNEDELDKIFINNKHTKIENSSKYNSNNNEELLKAINKLKEQFIESQRKSDRQYKELKEEINELRKENKELKEQVNELRDKFNKYILNVDLPSNKEVTKIFNKIEKITVPNIIIKQEPQIETNEIDISLLSEVEGVPDEEGFSSIELIQSIQKKARYLNANYLNNQFPKLFKIIQTDKSMLELYEVNCNKKTYPIIRVKKEILIKYLGKLNDLIWNTHLDELNYFYDIWPIEVIRKYKLEHDLINLDYNNNITNRNDIYLVNSICVTINQHFIFINEENKSTQHLIDYLKQNTDVLNTNYQTQIKDILKHLELRTQ